MEAVLSNLPSYVTGGSLLLTSLVVVATVIARFTKSKKDDVAVGKVRDIVLRIVKFLPTLGINPETKKLEEALKELKDDKTSNPN